MQNKGTSASPPVNHFPVEIKQHMASMIMPLQSLKQQARNKASSQLSYQKQENPQMKRLIGPMVRQKLDAIKLSNEDSSANSLERQDAIVAHIMNQWQKDHAIFNEGLSKRRKGPVGSMVRKGSVVSMASVISEEQLQRLQNSSSSADTSQIHIQSITREQYKLPKNHPRANSQLTSEMPTQRKISLNIVIDSVKQGVVQPQPKVLIKESVKKVSNFLLPSVVSLEQLPDINQNDFASNLVKRVANGGGKNSYQIQKTLIKDENGQSESFFYHPKLKQPINFVQLQKNSNSDFGSQPLYRENTFVGQNLQNVSSNNFQRRLSQPMSDYMHQDTQNSISKYIINDPLLKNESWAPATFMSSQSKPKVQMVKSQNPSQYSLSNITDQLDQSLLRQPVSEVVVPAKQKRGNKQPSMKKRQTSVIPHVQHLEMSGNQADQLGEQSLIMESPEPPTTLFKNETMNRSQEEIMVGLGLNFGNVHPPQIYKNSFVNHQEQRIELKKLLQKMSENKSNLSFSESKRILNGADSQSLASLSPITQQERFKIANIHGKKLPVLKNAPVVESPIKKFPELSPNKIFPQVTKPAMGVKDHSQYLPASHRLIDSDLLPIHTLSITKNDKKDDTLKKKLNSDILDVASQKISATIKPRTKNQMISHNSSVDCQTQDMAIDCMLPNDLYAPDTNFIIHSNNHNSVTPLLLQQQQNRILYHVGQNEEKDLNQLIDEFHLVNQANQGYFNESIIDEELMSTIDHRMPAKQNLDGSQKLFLYSGGGSFGPHPPK